ncbi:hypothetical protein EDF73_11828 [Raoultella sp. BIGb0138]|nr:hypothetical protein EDF73_11828 [Raoultella sp. BIGb0138]
MSTLLVTGEGLDFMPGSGYNASLRDPSRVRPRQY